MLSTMLRGVSEDVDVSIRNFSAQATRGRKTKKFVPTTMITMATMAMITLGMEPSLPRPP